MKRVVLVLDGSAESRKAALWCGIHLGTRVEVVAVAAISPFGAFVLGLPQSRGADPMPDIRRALEEHWCEPLRDGKLAHRTMLVNGATVPALLEVAQREDADAIVIGKPAHGFLSEHVLWSVAADLVHHSPIPVIVVPSG